MKPAFLQIYFIDTKSDKIALSCTIITGVTKVPMKFFTRFRHWPRKSRYVIVPYTGLLQAYTNAGWKRLSKRSRGKLPVWLSLISSLCSYSLFFERTLWTSLSQIMIASPSSLKCCTSYQAQSGSCLSALCATVKVHLQLSACVTDLCAPPCAGGNWNRWKSWGGWGGALRVAVVKEGEMLKACRGHQERTQRGYANFYWAWQQMLINQPRLTNSQP